jgi:hypothetical protein
MNPPNAVDRIAFPVYQVKTEESSLKPMKYTPSLNNIFQQAIQSCNGEITLEKDLRVLSKFFEKPPQMTYDSPQGVFYYPLVSNNELWEWFQHYLEEGLYNSISIAANENHLGKIINFDGMATCVTLVKKEEQRQMSANPSSNFFRNQFSSFFKKLMPQKPENSKALKIIKPNDQAFICLELMDKPKKLNNYEDCQQKILTKLRKNLPAMLKTWNFKSFEILDEKVLLKYGLTQEVAQAGDRIIFFHKKFEEKENDHFTKKRKCEPENEEIAKPFFVYTSKILPETNSQQSSNLPYRLSVNSKNETISNVSNLDNASFSTHQKKKMSYSQSTNVVVKEPIKVQIEPKYEKSKVDQFMEFFDKFEVFGNVK